MHSSSNRKTRRGRKKHQPMRSFTIPPAVLQLFLLLSGLSPATSCTEQEKHFSSSSLGRREMAPSPRRGTMRQTAASGKASFAMEMGPSLRSPWHLKDLKGASRHLLPTSQACNGDGAVTEISLASKGLEGRISPSLADLTGLLHVNLSHNSFSSGLPLELMSSSSIIALDVSFNRLNGMLQELPSSITTDRPLQVLNVSSNQFSLELPSATWKMMKNLIAFNASNNGFTRHIPSSLCLGSPSLALLNLCHNQLSGGIPNTLGNCSKLKVLKAGNNHLSGILPVEIFHATSLEYLSIPNNGLQGELDGAQMVKLSNLATLDLGENHISGNIPESIGQLRRLEKLHLGNNMSEELPSTMGNCTDLKTIDLKVNNFSGDLGEVNFSTPQNIRSLDLMRNRLGGIVPESIYSCSMLTALRLSGNHFHGEISPRIGNLKHLSFLSLGSNSFTNIMKALHALKSCRNISKNK
ncbi:receptor-like protein 2 [Triticum urartu]|uniref:receptor-like protein 2 n=1 Tax=Triticum urartu TaxID=4572 RepID=UPI002043288E|nr:receptor-like protein 2 [Triticum urartu]